MDTLSTDFDLKEFMEKGYKFVDDCFKEDNHTLGAYVQELAHDNVVSAEKLRKVQIKMLDKLAQYISSTFGPMGSNSMIVTGESSQTTLANYSKDGKKVLKYIAFNQPLEMAIQTEMVDIAEYVDKQVGDGTTSSVILTDNIFKRLAALEKVEKIPPRKIVKEFKEVVKELQRIIAEQGRECTMDDIYDICMVSTNGNEEVSKQIQSIYKEYGMNVSIDVGISNDQDTKVKIYDGLTLDSGMNNAAYINNHTGTCEIRNPRIYCFKDPIDTGEMVSYLEKIILTNILEPAQNNNLQDMIPTVIVTPRITQDASGMLSRLVEILLSYNEDMYSQKPPILIVSDIAGISEFSYIDIAQLCKAKLIRKYIDPEIQKKDQESGNAPTLDNITEWFGTAESVISDNEKTKFINPVSMTTEGDTTYDMIINHLKAEIKTAEDENEDILTIGRLKKRLRSLEANMIDFLVGGINISDRDSVKDLVEDAVKNCKSAISDGVGRAANFEGLNACLLYNLDGKSELNISILKAICRSYIEAAKILYSTVLPEDDVYKAIKLSCDIGEPLDVTKLIEFDNFAAFDYDIREKGEPCKILCSIKTDQVILEAISRIVTNMVTANQSLLQAPSVNKY